MKRLPAKLRNFIIFIYIFTAASLIYFFNTSYLSNNITSPVNIIFFAILIALTETYSVTFRDMSLSTTFAIELAAYVLFGPLSTLIIYLLGFSLRVIKKDNNTYSHILNTPLFGTIFNYCVLALPLLYGNYFYILLGGSFSVKDISSYTLPLVVFSMACFFTNTFIMSIMFSVTRGKNIFYSFISNARLLLLNFLALAPFGIILSYIFYEYSYWGILVAICPVILARYTFTLYIESKSQYVQTVDVLMRAMEARDKYTEGHSQRVGKLVEMIAKELKYNQWKIEQLNFASLLHDVGKIGIDDNILNKPGKLSDEEFAIIKTHPKIGHDILKDIKYLQNIIPIVLHHHERYDGKGYPNGKTADELGMDVFIVQLADSIDAMATDRPYRKALTEDQIIDEIKKNSGTQFHPTVVDAYLNAIQKQKK